MTQATPRNRDEGKLGAPLSIASLHPVFGNFAANKNAITKQLA
jgi:hypothetical protein